MKKWKQLTLAALMVSALAACEGEQFTRGLGGEVTAQGRWTVDEHLYRIYDVSVMDAYNTSRKFFEDQGWTIVNMESKPAFGRVEGRMKDGREVKIVAQAEKMGPTEIGVHVGQGDLAESVAILDRLETVLGGKRIQSNPAN